MEKEIILRESKRREMTFETHSHCKGLFVLTNWKDNSQEGSIILSKEDVEKMLVFINS